MLNHLYSLLKNIAEILKKEQVGDLVVVLHPLCLLGSLPAPAPLAPSITLLLRTQYTPDTQLLNPSLQSALNLKSPHSSATTLVSDNSTNFS